MDREVRVRFAPSPTGALHIGGVRTALYNFLLAKKLGGKMILRIEDTDQNRFVPGAEDYIKESLKWCGITLDEGPDQGGPYAPYKQSERKAIYWQYSQQLIDSGAAYYAFDTPEELDALRERLKEAEVANLTYNAISRMTMKNSLTLPKEEVDQKLASGDPYVIRFKMPKKEEIRLFDMIRGWVMVHSATLDDKVLMKSDGMPTYHLANVVDDYLMKITHVIRGEEWLPSAPLHVMLYKYLGWTEVMPKFAHLPLLLKPDGKGKLSKRDGEKQGFPVFPLLWTDPETGAKVRGFREDGYLPEALVNFVAMLGWNPGTEQEIFSMDELIAAFEVERIGKAGAKFDINKANWFNQQYIKAKSDSELVTLFQAHLTTMGISCENEKAMAIVSQMKERVTFLTEIYLNGKFYFERPTEFDEKTVAKKWNEEAVGILQQFAEVLSGKSDLTAEEAKALLEQTLATTGAGIGKIMPTLRVSITGEGGGPDLMGIIAVLGARETSERILQAIDTIEKKS
jgi:glutamyl-tRNA synthetase